MDAQATNVIPDKKKRRVCSTIYNFFFFFSCKARVTKASLIFCDEYNNLFAKK